MVAESEAPDTGIPDAEFPESTAPVLLFRKLELTDSAAIPLPEFEAGIGRNPTDSAGLAEAFCAGGIA
ncbi:MAG TPA: hypothetical protein VKC60_06715, partial [Opitutaceae bacterium]|nr:hypothetical protein [Opitutaceae bacterium]